MFKPSGGRMGESDMDYDTDEKSMAALKRRLLKAQSAYYRYKRYSFIHSFIRHVGNIPPQVQVSFNFFALHQSPHLFTFFFFTIFLFAVEKQCE
jgi:hypothetical protein